MIWYVGLIHPHGTTRSVDLPPVPLLAHKVGMPMQAGRMARLRAFLLGVCVE